MELLQQFLCSVSGFVIGWIGWALVMALPKGSKDDDDFSGMA